MEMENEFEYDFEEGELEALRELFNYPECENGTWALNPKSVEAFGAAAKIITKEMKGQNVTVEVNPFSESSKLGTIAIKSKELIVFRNPKVVAELGRYGVGIDFTAYLDGTTEVLFSFKTATKIND